MKIKKFIESSKAIAPFKPGPVDAVLKLDANENLFLDKEKLREILVEAAMETDPRLYPQGEEASLKRLIAEVNGVEAGQVVVSAGGDQIIELLYSLLGRGDSVTAVSPTFSMYPRLAQQRGLEYRKAPLEPDFTFNLEETLEVAEGSSILVICNPNNPTGNQFPREAVLWFVEGFDGLVLVDEAYCEYSGYSLVDVTGDYDNLVVLRTFSKAYGLAGLRLGYLVANVELASTLRERYHAPYPVSNLVLSAGCEMIQQQELIQDAVEETKLEREWLTDQLNNMDGVVAYPSDANFVLFKTEKPYEAVFEALRSKGVLIRKIGTVLGGENYLRVSVAPRPMLMRFIEALEEALR